MVKRKIYFRADAGRNIGYGHYIRCLALADMLKDDFDCTFFTQNPSAYQKKEAESVCPLVALPADDTKFNLFLEQLQGDEIVVLDNYFFTSDYQLEIKRKGCKLVCIDDMHDKHYYADVVVNHGITSKSLFDVERYTRLCLGLDYALLRKPFLTTQQIEKEEGKWFISFGGTDYFNLTEKFLAILNEEKSVKSIVVVIGDAYKYKDNLVRYQKVGVKRNLTAWQMAEELQSSQYAILPSSSVCIEALSCKCRIAAGYFVDNQKEFASIMSKKKYVYGIGSLIDYNRHDLFDKVISFAYKIPDIFIGIRERYINTFKEL